jgi:DNA-binding SARP family transcriptional activator
VDSRVHMPSHSTSASGSVVRYVGLFAGGGLLAACAAAAITAHRRRQFARRRPGRMIATPSSKLVPIEKAISVASRPAMARVEFLDLALRDLAARLASGGNALPDVVAAGLNDDHLELALAHPVASLPDPWEKRSETRWALPRSTVLDDANADRLAPYPCLVSAGHTANGTDWLIDLEHARVVQVVGAADRTVALTRFMAAELALNNWSDDLTATLAGFGGELSGANPSRLCYSDDVVGQAERVLRTEAQVGELGRQQGVDVLAGRLQGVRGDAWMPHVLLVKPDALDDPAVTAVSKLISEIAGQPRRSPVTVVVVGSTDGGSAWEITVTGDGHLQVPGLDVDDLVAHSLTEVEGGDIAAAIALARDGAPDVVVPASEGVQPCDAYIDRAGALLPDFTVPRIKGAVSVTEPSEASSVLPLPSPTYVTEAATTTEDVEALAPIVTTQVRTTVEEATSALDRDLADWEDPDCRRPKLTLLGPVQLTAHGQPPKSGWGGICTEAVAYLALHPRGVSGDQLAADLWPEREYDGTSRYVQNILSAARKWLGVDARTASDYMPWLTKSWIETYRVDGLLVDADLFRQLRARGTARGSEGLPDLIAALKLVSGRPLERLRRDGYSWLEPGEGTLYEGMIEEVAHLVAMSALADDNAERARWASQIVLGIDACNERALCDLATSYMIEGKQPELDATVKRLRDLEDITDRTYDVMRRQGWLAGRR